MNKNKVEAINHHNIATILASNDGNVKMKGALSPTSLSRMTRTNSNYEPVNENKTISKNSQKKSD